MRWPAHQITEEQVMKLNRSEIKQKAKQAIKGNIFSYFLVVIISSLITGSVSFVTSIATTVPTVISEIVMYANDSYEPSMFMIIGALVLFIVSFVLGFIATSCAQMSQMYAALNIYDKSNCDISDVSYGYKHFKRAIAISLKQSIYIALWSMLFIIPGIIKTYEYSQAMYISMDNPELSAEDCLKRSKKLMYGHKFELFVWGLSFCGWMILSSFTCGILYIWLTPYMQSSLAGFYRELVNQKDGSMFVESMITDTGDFTEA